MADPQLIELSPNAVELANLLDEICPDTEDGYSIVVDQNKFAEAAELTQKVKLEAPELAEAAWSKVIGFSPAKANALLSNIAVYNNGKSPVDLEAVTECWPMESRLQLAENIADSITGFPHMRALSLEADSLALKAFSKDKEPVVDDFGGVVGVIYRADKALKDADKTGQVMALYESKEAQASSSEDAASQDTLEKLSEKMAADDDLVNDPAYVKALAEDTLLFGAEYINGFVSRFDKESQAAAFAQAFAANCDDDMQNAIPTEAQKALEEMTESYLSLICESPSLFVQNIFGVSDMITEDRCSVKVIGEGNLHAASTAVAVVKDGSVALQKKATALLTGLFNKVEADYDGLADVDGVGACGMIACAAKAWDAPELYRASQTAYVCRKEAVLTAAYKEATALYQSGMNSLSEELGGTMPPLGNGELPEAYLESLIRIGEHSGLEQPTHDELQTDLESHLFGVFGDGSGYPMPDERVNNWIAALQAPMRDQQKIQKRLDLATTR